MKHNFISINSSGQIYRSTGIFGRRVIFPEFEIVCSPKIVLKDIIERSSNWQDPML